MWSSMKPPTHYLTGEHNKTLCFLTVGEETPAAPDHKLATCKDCQSLLSSLARAARFTDLTPERNVRNIN